MELTIENLIKMIIGVLVFVIVVVGVYFFFKNYVIEFFREGNQTSEIILSLIK
jgi:hypothetical protein